VIDNRVNRKLLWLLLLAWLSCLGCSSIAPADFDTPEITLEGLRPLSIGGTEARFAVDLRVLNPNAIALDVEGVYFEVFLHDSKVLSGASSKAVKIPAYGEGTFTLETGIGMLRAVNLMRELAEKPGGNIPYRLKTKISLAQLPYAVRLEDSGMIGED
jgi:LEA14-like dessication related protein